MKLVLCVLTFISVNVFAQTCIDDIPESTPTDDFFVQVDGTVTDRTTGLMWMRCSIGQTWTGTNCIGEATQLTWQESLQSAHGFVFAERTGWRVPNVKELATITERACVRPAINETLFPNTQSDDFWTSSPSVSDANRAWVVAFFNSSNAIKDKELFVFTRLVRTADVN